jgi:hypothetical protein
VIKGRAKVGSLNLVARDGLVTGRLVPFFVLFAQQLFELDG